MEVKIYTTPTCGYCHQAKQFLTERGVRFTEYDVSRDRAAAEEMGNLTGQMGVPVIVVDSQVVIGFDRARLETLLSNRDKGQRPHFGLKIADASKAAARPGLAPVPGALVGGVAASSLGAKAGLGEGDIITGVNSQPIGNAGDLERAFSTLAYGDRVGIVFIRGQETRKTEIRI